MATPSDLAHLRQNIRVSRCLVEPLEQGVAVLVLPGRGRWLGRSAQGRARCRSRLTANDSPWPAPQPLTMDRGLEPVLVRVLELAQELAPGLVPAVAWFPASRRGSQRARASGWPTRAAGLPTRLTAHRMTTVHGRLKGVDAIVHCAT